MCCFVVIPMSLYLSRGLARPAERPRPRYKDLRMALQELRLFPLLAMSSGQVPRRIVFLQRPQKQKLQGFGGKVGR
jgi:hypothetical protein